MQGNGVWVDEWVRRRNGDGFHVQEVVLGEEVDVCNTHLKNINDFTHEYDYDSECSD